MPPDQQLGGRYGHFRYGVYEYTPPETPGFDEPLTDRSPSPEEAFGSGIALEPSDGDGIPWDVAVNAAGDFAVTSGWQELGKDIAFEIAKSNVSLIGALQSANSRVQIESSVRRLVRTDPRVESVERIDIRSQPDGDGLRIRTRLRANSNELHDVVVPIANTATGQPGGD